MGIGISSLYDAICSKIVRPNPVITELDRRTRHNAKVGESRTEEHETVQDRERAHQFGAALERETAWLRAQLEEYEKQVAEARQELIISRLQQNIRPVKVPTRKQFEETKERLEYREGVLHFAVSGASGSGKSTLINALRGLRAKSQSAARVGRIETTAKITRYQDPDPNIPIAWYDIPGAGTLNFPGWDYFNRQGLFAFDAIIVVYNDRFTELDAEILKNCALFQIPTYIVRSRSQYHIQNSMKEDLDDDDQQADDDDEAALANARNKYIEETRNNLAENLQKAGLLDQRVYLVDSMDCLVHLAKRYRQKREGSNGQSAGKKKVKVSKEVTNCIDEIDLVHDLLQDAVRRRGEPSWLKSYWQYLDGERLNPARAIDANRDLFAEVGRKVIGLMDHELHLLESEPDDHGPRDGEWSKKFGGGEYRLNTSASALLASPKSVAGSFCTYESSTTDADSTCTRESEEEMTADVEHQSGTGLLNSKRASSLDVLLQPIGDPLVIGLSR